MQIFPADNIDVEPLIRELIGVGLIQAYEAEGKMYLNIRGWHHQKISNPSYKYPALHEGSIVLDIPRESSRVLDSPRQSYPPEGKGRDVEGKGIDLLPAAATLPPAQEAPAAPASGGASLKRDYDGLLADCIAAVGQNAPVSPVLGAMADCIDRFGRETVLRKLAELSREKRPSQVKTWNLWAKIVTEAIIASTTFAAAATPEDPLVKFSPTREAVPKSMMIAQLKLYRDKPHLWDATHWGQPPNIDPKMNQLARDLIGLEIPLEGQQRSEAAE